MKTNQSIAVMLSTAMLAIGSCASTLISARATDAPNSTTRAIVPVPAFLAHTDLGAGRDLAQAQELSATLNTYLRGKYRIVNAHYFENRHGPWVAIAKGTASHLRDNGYIPLDYVRSLPDWHSPGYDLVDLYPSLLQGGSFAVAMGHEKLGNGSYLVGYFQLEAIVPSAP